MFLNKKYQRPLKPTSEYLVDELVLAQAWKKAHQYIRSTNWYADIFELDKSSINLEDNVKEWASALTSSIFQFDVLKLVPAPKTDSWHFAQNTSEKEDEECEFIWKPVKDNSKTLRPLAHVSIRDQSITTALMMCMANNVESLQGDTSTEFDEVHQKRVVNYGNRLDCTYQDGKANYSWGNQSTYSQYYQDYQKFLERPKHFGMQAIQQAFSDETIFEIHLDLKKFYDEVRREILVDKIKDLLPEQDGIAANILNAFISWEWSKESSQLYSNVCSDEFGFCLAATIKRISSTYRQ